MEFTLSTEGVFERLMALLEQLKLEANLKILEKGPAVDPVTMLWQASLAEEWESDEDNRWDSIL
jgi:hypothetical protein